jgi:hypothetical protein
VPEVPRAVGSDTRRDYKTTALKVIKNDQAVIKAQMAVGKVEVSFRGAGQARLDELF